MLATGRPAALLLAALLLPGVLAACGEPQEPLAAEPSLAPSVTSSSPSASPSAVLRCVGPASAAAVPSYGPSGFADTPGDAPPNYADNHAFQRRLSLCGKDLERGEAEAARVESALDHLAGATSADVARILEELGHDPREAVVGDEGEQVHFAVMAAPACLDGLVGPDGARVEALGLYAEGGCVKPVGGH